MEDRTQRGGAFHQPSAEAGPLRMEKCGFSGRSYHGLKEDGICKVWVEETTFDPVQNTVNVGERCALPLRLDVKNHSPTGLAWGYGGSGPAQLALALLIHATGDLEVAQEWYQEFKRAVVAGLGGSWTLTAREIQAFVASRQPKD